MKDYNGKTIYLGIDVHKKTYALTIICDGTCVKRDTMPAYPQRLVAYLFKYFPGATIHSAYEAGFSGFGLHRYLLEQGINNIVVHPASVEIESRNRVKNDKRDSLKIAVQLSVGRLRGIFVPTPQMEDKRELSRLRSLFVKERNRTATRLKLKANQFGLIGPQDCSKVSSKWIKNIQKKEMNPGLRYAMEALIEEWEGFAEKIKKVEELLKTQAQEDEVVEKIYTSVKGVGPTSARILANELGDMSQFTSESTLFSYTGLTPSEYSSGEHIRKGHITRQGKPILRSILVQCSWVAIKYNPGLREVYERISKRAGAKRAIVAIARRLIGRIRACFRKREKYCEKLEYQGA